MEPQPEKLSAMLDTLATVDVESERIQILLDFADRFKPVPEKVARHPYPERNRVPYCESDAYVWAERQVDGTVKLYFAVENPSGISAKALAYILDRTLSGRPPEEVSRVSPEIVNLIFRQNISMGKGMGLMAMVDAVRALAQKAAAGKG